MGNQVHFIVCKRCKANTVTNPWRKGHCISCWEIMNPQERTIAQQRLVVHIQEACTDHESMEDRRHLAKGRTRRLREDEDA